MRRLWASALYGTKLRLLAPLRVVYGRSANFDEWASRKARTDQAERLLCCYGSRNKRPANQSGAPPATLSIRLGSDRLSLLAWETRHGVGLSRSGRRP